MGLDVQPPRIDYLAEAIRDWRIDGGRGYQHHSGPAVCEAGVRATLEVGRNRRQGIEACSGGAQGGNAMSLRAVKEVIHTQATREGAGVKLERAFGFGKTKEFDPFLLLDDFRNNNPADYLAGFPWHPHRGFEPITYVLAGPGEHGAA